MRQFKLTEEIAAKSGLDLLDAVMAHCRAEAAIDEGDYRADMRRRVGAGSGVWVKILLRELLGLTESQPLALGAA
jgi:hypothetical protein